MSALCFAVYLSVTSVSVISPPNSCRSAESQSAIACRTAASESSLDLRMRLHGDGQIRCDPTSSRDR